MLKRMGFSFISICERHIMTTITSPVKGYTSIGTKLTIGESVVINTKPEVGTIGTNVVNGVQNPDRDMQILRRINATTPYTAVYYNLVAPGWFEATARNSSNWLSEQCGFMPVSAYPYSNCDHSVIADIANAKIKAKIQSDKGDFALLSNVLEDVYELRKTIVGTLESIGGLMRGIQKILHLNPGGGPDIVHYAAELWLAWSFGINPTIADANDVMESIEKYLSRKNHVKHFVANHKDDCKGSDKTSYSNFGIDYSIHVQQYQVSRCKFIAAMDLKLLSGNDYGPRAHFHLCPTDIVPMLWELLPWSWLVDYVTTAGAFLTDVFQSDSDLLVYGIKNTKVENHYIVSAEISAASNWWLIGQPKMYPRIYSSLDFQRASISTLPRRMLRFKTGEEMSKNLTNKILNLASIGVTRQRRA